MGSDPVEDKADKTLVVSATTIGSIYQLPPEFDSDGGGEVGMDPVGDCRGTHSRSPLGRGGQKRKEAQRLAGQLGRIRR
jgi:hypothetical protein